GQAGDDDQLVARQGQVDVLQVVGTRPTDQDLVHVQRASHGGRKGGSIRAGERRVTSALIRPSRCRPARICGPFHEACSFMHDSSSERMSPAETRAAGGLAMVFAFRMLGMFMVLPVLATY